MFGNHVSLVCLVYMNPSFFFFLINITLPFFLEESRPVVLWNVSCSRFISLWKEEERKGQK